MNTETYYSLLIVALIIIYCKACGNSKRTTLLDKMYLYKMGLRLKKRYTGYVNIDPNDSGIHDTENWEDDSEGRKPTLN